MKIVRPLLAWCGLVLAISSALTAADRDEPRNRDVRPGRDEARVVLYDRPNFKGDSYELELGAEVTNLAALRFSNGGKINDRVSSIYVGRGAAIKFYVDPDFRGEFLEITRSVENLSAMRRAGGASWNDSITSLRVTEARHAGGRDRDPSQEARVILFRHANFGGEAVEVFPGEKFANLGNETFESGGSLNDEISSVRVVGPVRLRLYPDSKFRGVFIDITEDAPDLSRLSRKEERGNWNDRASSLEVEWVGPPRQNDAGTDGERN